MISIHSNELLPISILTHKMYHKYNMCMDNISTWANPFINPVRKYYNFCMLELKMHFNKTKYDRFQLKKQYKYVMINEMNTRFQLNKEDNVRRILYVRELSMVKHFIKCVIPNYADLPENEYIERVAKDYTMQSRFVQFINTNIYEKPYYKIEGLKYYRVKVSKSKIDIGNRHMGIYSYDSDFVYSNWYKAPIIPMHSHIYLKHWDKTTKKASLKGLKADTDKTRSWEGGSSYGWKFNGYIDADYIEYFCKQNGFKKEKGQKYYYGDYAMWMLKVLE